MGTHLPRPKKGPEPPIFGLCLLWPQTAGWMKTSLGTEADLGQGHIVSDGDPVPPPREKSHQPPLLFGPWLLCPRSSILVTAELLLLVMVALWNWGRPLYFCPVVSSSIFYISLCLSICLSIYLLSSPNLSCRILDVCHTSTHGVALVQI